MDKEYPNDKETQEWMNAPLGKPSSQEDQVVFWSDKYDKKVDELNEVWKRWKDAEEKINRLTSALVAAHEALEEIELRLSRRVVSGGMETTIAEASSMDEQLAEVRDILKDKFGKLAHERWKELQQTLKDYEEMHTDHKRLVRELDVALNGDKAAKQASLCDLVAWIPRRWNRMEAVVKQLANCPVHHFSSCGCQLSAKEALDAEGGVK